MESIQDCSHVAITMENVDEEKETATRPHEIDEEKGGCPGEQDLHAQTGVSNIRSVITIAILTFIHVIIFMDRYIVAGVLPDLQKAFQIDDSVSGLIDTVFMVSYMLLAPVFGYLGDRWNRKYIIIAGMSLWSITPLGTSFIPNEYFVLLLVMRGLAGAAEAHFGTIAPCIIADLFVADQRSRMLAIYYFAIPVGCGLGYITGAQVISAAGGDWHWAFRVTPGLGLIAVLLVIFFVKEPPRGATDGKSDNTSPSSNNWLSDIKKLLINPSYMFSTLGSAAEGFVAGAVGLWAPTFLQRARISLQETEPSHTVVSNHNDSMIFGGLTVVSGILGVIIGVEISKRYRKVNPRADPLVCACGMLFSAPFLFLALIFGNINLVATYVFIFFGDMLLTLNWAIVADILLYVVGPTRRSTAQAVQIMICHLLGDAGGPYITGLIADVIRRGWADSPLLRFRSLEYALMVCAFVAVIGGGFFMATALFIEKDREKAEMESED